QRGEEHGRPAGAPPAGGEPRQAPGGHRVAGRRGAARNARGQQGRQGREPPRRPARHLGSSTASWCIFSVRGGFTMTLIRAIVVAAACLPLVVFAQAPKKKSAEQVWNDLYAKREGKEHQFNKFLAETVKGRAPGKALDIGMGQGRNSLFLAALGWDVTGFDISEVGVKQAQAEAQKRGLKLNAQVGDVDKFNYGKAQYDLVVGMYMHEYLT